MEIPQQKLARFPVGCGSNSYLDYKKGKKKKKKAAPRKRNCFETKGGCGERER
jgi:hypothetical protein